MKKILSLLLSFVMLFSLAMPAMAAEDTVVFPDTIYFSAGPLLSEDASAWNDSVEARFYDADGIYLSLAYSSPDENGLYSFTNVPEGTGYVCFTDMWEGETTANLTPDAGTNLYTLDGGTDASGNYTGTWSTYGSSGSTEPKTEGDVTASYTPTPGTITGMSLTGENVTYDTGSNTYTVLFPAGTENVTYTHIISGTNLTNYRTSYQLYWRETFKRDGAEDIVDIYNVSEYNFFSFDETNGTLNISCTPTTASVGYTVIYEYSNDGSNSWTTAFTQVFEQAYTITNATTDTNGTISIPGEAAAGDSVTLTVTPASGYELDTLTVTDAEGNPVTVENNAFTMPASDVTVSATFKKASGDDTTVVYNVTGALSGWDATDSDYNMTKNADGTHTLTLTGVAAGTYEFKITANGVWGNPGEYPTDGNTANLSVTVEKDDSTVTFTYDPSVPTVTTNVTAPGDSGDDTTATITGLYVTIDGTKYDSTNTSADSPAKITDESTVVITVTGTNLNDTDTNGNCMVEYMSGYASDLGGGAWTINADGTSAAYTVRTSDYVYYATAFEFGHCNDGSTNYTGSGVYVIYHTENPATITGLSVTGGASYDAESNTYTVTPDGTPITVTITGMNLQNATSGNVVEFRAGYVDHLIHNSWSISEDGTTATQTFPNSDYVDTTTAFEFRYSNDYTSDQRTWVNSGVYVIYKVPHTVTGYTDGNGNKVEADVTEALEGDTVTLTVTATGTYQLGSIAVKDEEGNTVDFATTGEASGVYTFVMPDSAVTVEATFEVPFTYSADIIWGSLSFTYSDTVPEGETEEIGWTCEDGANVITVKNTGETTFDAQPLYTQKTGFESINGYFYDSAEAAQYVTYADMAPGESFSFYLVLSGKPTKALDGDTIGTVTIKIFERGE